MDLSKLSNEDLLKLERGELKFERGELPVESVYETVTATPAAPEPTAMEKVADVFTGSLRETPEIANMESYVQMPELRDISWPVTKTALSTLMTNPQETAAIIKQQFPDIPIRQDEKGNFILTSNFNKKDYVIPPGIEPYDLLRGVGAIGAFTPAGRATTVPKMIGASAATQAGIETGEELAGGEFNTGNVMLAGALPALGALRPLAGAVTGKIKELFKGKPQGAQEVTQPIAEAIEAVPLEQLSATAKQAGLGKKSAVEELSVQAMPDPEKLAAAKQLGIEDYLQPDHVTTNQSFRELSQAVKSYPGSLSRAQEVEGLLKVSQRADNIIKSLGADDVSMISDAAKRQLQEAHDVTYQEAGKLYDEIRKTIPATTQVNPQSILTAINARAEELGGKEFLSSAEKNVLSKLSPKNGKMPTYALLDDVRRDIVAAKFKNQGAFKDSDDRLLDIINNALRDDQKKVAEQFGMADKFELAQKTTSTYKAMQDDLKALFGETLSDSIVGDISSSTRALAKGDTSKFINMLNSIKYLPKEQKQQIVAAGLNTAFGKTLRGESVNFGAYAEWYRGLQKNKQAYTALMSNLPTQTVKDLDALYKVSDGISKAARERIGTGRIQVVEQIVKDADSAIGKMYEAAKQSSGRLAMGATADLIGTGGAGMAFAIGSALAKNKTPAMQAVDKVISSPQFIKAATNPTPDNVKKLAYNQQFINFMKYVKDNSTLSERERFILSTVQSQKPKE